MQIGGLGVNGAAAFDGTSQIQKSAKKTVKNAITDGFVKQIQTLAQEDAQKGIYMDKGFSQLRRARMEQYVSPDRAGPMAKVNSVMNTLKKSRNGSRSIWSAFSEIIPPKSKVIQHFGRLRFIHQKEN